MNITGTLIVIMISQIEQRNMSQIVNQGARWPSVFRALARTGDRTVPARFESHCGKLRYGTVFGRDGELR